MRCRHCGTAHSGADSALVRQAQGLLMRFQHGTNLEHRCDGTANRAIPLAHTRDSWLDQRGFGRGSYVGNGPAPRVCFIIGCSDSWLSWRNVGMTVAADAAGLRYPRANDFRQESAMGIFSTIMN